MLNVSELLNKKFILLHVNCHVHEGEKYYFPAEIAALEFNLSEGVLRTYHQIVGLGQYFKIFLIILIWNNILINIPPIFKIYFLCTNYRNQN